MNLQEIVIELSERLADESDYDENLEPKLQKLLNFFNEQREDEKMTNERSIKQTWLDKKERQLVIKMETAYTIADEIFFKFIDHEALPSGVREIFIEDDIENNGTKNTAIGTELYYSIENKIIELLKKTEEAI